MRAERLAHDPLSVYKGNGVAANQGEKMRSYESDAALKENEERRNGPSNYGRGVPWPMELRNLLDAGVSQYIDLKATNKTHDDFLTAAKRWANLMVDRHPQFVGPRKAEHLSGAFIKKLREVKPDLAPFLFRRGENRLKENGNGHTPAPPAAAPQPTIVTTTMINIPSDTPEDSRELLPLLGHSLKRIYQDPDKLYELVELARQLSMPKRPTT